MTQYLEELVQKISTKADLKAFDDLDKKQKRARKENDLLAKSFRRAFAIFLSVQGVRSIVETTRKFDLLQKSIKGLTKSAQDFEYLRKEAYRTGNDLTTIAESYKNFYSAATGVGFGKGAIQSMFSDVLVAGRGIGASQSQIHSALVALEQMLSKGKVSAQELRLQMGNALPGAFEIAARAMNMTTQELDELMSKGQLASTVFVPKFTAQLKKELGQGFEANIKSLDFALVNLSTAWQEFQANILQGEAGEALADLVRQITSLLRSSTVLNAIKIISKAIGLIVKNLKWILMFWGVNKLLQIGTMLSRLRFAILDVATATTRAGVASQMMAEGFLLLGGSQTITGIRMLTAGLWAMVAPVLVLSAKIALIISGILMLQDLLLTFADPTADTYTRDLGRGMKNLYHMVNRWAGDPNSPRPEALGLANPQQSTFGGAQFQVRDEDTLPYKFKQWREKHSSSPAINGGANYTGNYNKNSNSNQNNNISINIYPSPNQSEREIGDEIATRLGDILEDYVRTA